MKINKVKLHNFSSYEGNNEFDFEITDAGKNIVLIGGKNGAGKTSLFTAIKVALYGPLAYGYVGVNSHYISKIKDLINSKAFQQEVVESEVQLTLQLKIERDIRNYVITRKWDYTNQKLTEEYTVARDGKLLNDQELSYFENYLRSIIPPDLFEFFFPKVTDIDFEMMRKKEEFIYLHLENENQENILLGKFNDLTTAEKKQFLPDNLKNASYDKEANIWCQWCAVREKCLENYKSLVEI